MPSAQVFLSPLCLLCSVLVPIVRLRWFLYSDWAATFFVEGPRVIGWYPAQEPNTDFCSHLSWVRREMIKLNTEPGTPSVPSWQQQSWVT